jgi:hypothetical protein
MSYSAVQFATRFWSDVSNVSICGSKYVVPTKIFFVCLKRIMMMLNRSRLLVALAISACLSQAILADFGPYNVISQYVLSNTIACGPIVLGAHTGCEGSVTIEPEQRECAEEDEDPCDNFANSLLVTFGSKVVVNTTGPCHSAPGRVMIFWECQQDLTTRNDVPGGSSC